jgi:putative methylase
MKKRKLEILLQGIKQYEEPRPELEQYYTPSKIATDILFFAYSMGDIEGKKIADLGAGTGIFTIGACLLGAHKIYAVEIDSKVVEIMRENLRKYNCSAEIVNIDVRKFEAKVDTVLQNPPFGSQRRHADLPFLEKALNIANVVYTLHNANTSEFLERKIEEFGGKITHKKSYDFSIPHIYKFHTKERVERKVMLYRVLRRRF